MKFWVISSDDGECLWETFVIADSAEEALQKMQASNDALRAKREEDWKARGLPPCIRHTSKVDVYEAMPNQFGILESVGDSVIWQAAVIS
jgi:hypothetical protein